MPNKKHHSHNVYEEDYRSSVEKAYDTYGDIIKWECSRAFWHYQLRDCTDLDDLIQIAKIRIFNEWHKISKSTHIPQIVRLATRRACWRYMLNQRRQHIYPVAEFSYE